jgi:hypothetical protein
MELSQVIPQILRNKTPEDHWSHNTEMENCLSKAQAQAHGHSTHRGARQAVPAYIPDMTDPVSWSGLGQIKSSQSSQLAEVLY